MNGNGHFKPLTSEELLEMCIDYIEKSPDTAFMRRLSAIVDKKKLPSKRNGFTMKGKIDGQSIFLSTGEYKDGTLGEIFVEMHKEGATLKGLLNCFAIAVSIGLQYGVPLEEYVSKFCFTRFEPAGFVDHDYIRNSTSVVDYIFRVLAYEYLGREDLIHVVPDQANQLERNAAIHANGSAEKKTEIVKNIGIAIPKSVKEAKQPTAEARQASNSMNSMLKESQSDAPACGTCGNMTVRNGTCYKCLTCGSTTGCS